MKVITLKQPWATLVAEGIKKYEFRSWKTNYRGELFINAGQGVDKEAMEKVKHLGLSFPSKRIIASVKLAECYELNDDLNKIIIEEKNIAYGDKYRNGFAWKLEVIKKINNNHEVSGKLGLWNLEEN